MRGIDKVYYLLALHIAPNSTPLPPNPSSTSLVPKSIVALTSVPSAGKEKEQKTPTPVVELATEEVVEVEQLKKKKKEKEKEAVA